MSRTLILAAVTLALALVGWTGAGRAYDAADSITYKNTLLVDSGDERFHQPRGAAVDDEGYIYVADTSAHRIVLFNRLGRYMEWFGGEGSKPGQFYYPHGVSIGDLPSGNRGLYVIDGGNHRVQVFTVEGKPLRQFGSFGSGPGQLNTPAGIATARGVPGSGVWVADTRNNRIVQFTTSGRWVKAIDCAACAHGRLSVPTGIALYATGSSYRIYVAEENAHRVRVLTPEGREILSIGKLGSKNGELAFPDDIAVDGDGTLFVAEAGFGNERISVFSPTGKFVRTFKSERREPFLQPHGIAVGPDGKVVVVDTGSSEVVRFAVEPTSIEILAGFLQLKAPHRAWLRVANNDVDRTCDVGAEATFIAKTKTKRTVFLKSGATPAVHFAGKPMRFDLSPAQAGILGNADYAGVEVSFRATCGATKVVSKAKYEFRDD